MSEKIYDSYYEIYRSDPEIGELLKSYWNWCRANNQKPEINNILEVDETNLGHITYHAQIWDEEVKHLGVGKSFQASEDYSFLTQPKETQDLFRQRFKKNLEETLSLLELDAPNIIIMNQFWIAIRAAIGLAPREFFQHLAQDTLRKINPASGVCADCRQDMHKFLAIKAPGRFAQIVKITGKILKKKRS